MRYLKKFNESVTFLTDRVEINIMFDDLGIQDYEIEDDGTVNVYDYRGIELNFLSINRQQRYRRRKPIDTTSFPIKFGHVNRKFDFRDDKGNPTLTTLEGSPRTCGSFHITFANITNLKGSPLRVEDSFRIMNCPSLQSLEGCESLICRDFECSHTSITSLEGSPKNIPGVYNVQSNKLEDLKGGPDYVGNNLWAGGNPLTSLEGLPKFIGSRFDVNSPHIWDPKPLRDVKIGYCLTCKGTKIEHLLRVFHKIYNPNSWWDGGIHTSTEEYRTFIESLDYNWVKGDVNNPKIDLFRLREALDEFGISLEEVGVLPYHIDSVGPYQFVDLDGNRVNVWGKKI